MFNKKRVFSRVSVIRGNQRMTLKSNYRQYISNIKVQGETKARIPHAVGDSERNM